MSIADFLKDLPTHDAQNFQNFRTSQKRPSVYLPTEDDDSASEQHIVMDKRCVLLRYLTQQWDKKTLPRKRDHTNGENGTPTGNNTSASNCKKRRLEPPIEMN